MFFAANAGKRSLALDLKAPAGREAFLRLADRADVFVAEPAPRSRRAARARRRPLRARNTRLVHLLDRRLRARRPARATSPGYDPLMQAFSGIVA